MYSFRKERFVVMGVLIMGIVLTDMSSLKIITPAMLSGVMLSSSTSQEAGRGRQSAKTETGGDMEMKQIAEDMKNMQSAESLFHTDKIHPTKGTDLASIEVDMKHMLTAKELFATANVHPAKLDHSELKREMLDMKDIGNIRTYAENDGKYVSEAAEEATTLKKLSQLHSQAMGILHAKTQRRKS